MPEPLDLDDIQGLVLWGYGGLRAASYLMLAIDSPDKARFWLDSLAATVTSASMRATDVALNVALTPAGLGKLGLEQSTLAAFSLEFLDGLTPAHRSRLLGDIGESAPDQWAWGGPATESIDLVLMVFARAQDTLSEALSDQRAQFEAGGVRPIAELATVDLGEKEHFGFRDGISQPVIAGSPRPGPSMHTVNAGEFLLGYLNQHGQRTDRPLLDPALDPARLLPADADGSGRADLGRNGSYLVFRTLRQDVRGFWQYVQQATTGADGAGGEAMRTKLAAKMVGRWPSGAPLTKAPDEDDPSLATANDFDYYAGDASGFGCPIGAHVRRANPRDSLGPGPGTEQSIEVNKGHRLIRRGREYGTPIDPSTLFSPSSDADGDRGLHFICLCANIAQQFEFIQHSWVMSPKFDGLYQDPDPLLGVHDSASQAFTVQGRPVRRQFSAMSRFVTVRGGGYFFLPGLRAIRYLAHPRA